VYNCRASIIAYAKAQNCIRRRSSRFWSKGGRKKRRRQGKEGTVCEIFNGTRVFAIKPDRKPNANNKSGKTGVSWDKSKQRWHAVIEVQRKRINLGYFKNLEEAIDARATGEQKYYAPIFAQYQAAESEAKSAPSN